MKRKTISEVGPQAKAQAMLITLNRPMAKVVMKSRPQISAAQPAMIAPRSWPKNAADSTSPISAGFICHGPANAGSA